MVAFIKMFPRNFGMFLNDWNNITHRNIRIVYM